MLLHDVLDQFDKRHRFLRWMRIALVIGICLSSGFIALMFLARDGRYLNLGTHAVHVFMSSKRSIAPRSPQHVQSSKTTPETAPTGMHQSALFALTEKRLVATPSFVQSNATIPIGPFWDAPTQVGKSHEPFPEIKRSHHISFAKIPLPVVRPVQHIIGSTNKSDQTENPINISISKFAAQDHSDQTKKAMHQSGEAVHEKKTSDVDERRIAALKLEQNYISAGIDISTKVTGINGSTLEIRYLQFNDALVRKIMNVPSFAKTLGEVGFDEIVFTGIQGKTWSFPLPKIASQGHLSQ
jgi:hypothetical protein